MAEAMMAWRLRRLPDRNRRHTGSCVPDACRAGGRLNSRLKRSRHSRAGTPGILMSLDIFLRTTSQPSEEQIRAWLSGHLCRCTGYVPIATAALDAAQQLRETSSNV
jgi:hypothetical protein